MIFWLSIAVACFAPFFIPVKRMSGRKLGADESGVVAISAAFIMPVFVLLIAFGVNVASMQYQNQQTQFLAASAAMAGARAIATGGNPVEAAQTVIDHNKAALLKTGVLTVNTVEVQGSGAMHVSLQVVTPSLFPFPPMTGDHTSVADVLN